MIKESEDSFRMLFASNPRPMWVFDVATLAFLEVNDAAVAHYGYSREEFMQMHITDIRPQEDVPRLMQVVRNERASLNAASEWRHRLQDGRVIHVEVASHELIFQGREARLVVIQDISERRAARKALAAQARQFALLSELGLQALSGASIETLMDAAIRHVATELEVEYAKVLELLPGGNELILRAGVGWKDGYHPGETTVDAGLDSQAGYTLQTNEPVVVEDLRHDHRFNGPPLLRDHSVVSGISVIIPGGERPYGVLGAHTTRRRPFEAHDVAFVQALANILATAIERKRAEQMLRLNEERFRAVVHNAMHMVTIVDGNGVITYDSPPVQRMLGYAPQERLGANILSYVHPDDVAPVLEKLSELAVLKAAQATVQVRVQHRDGSWRVVEASGTNLLDNEALQGIVVNWYDVTERVRTQQEVERLNTELEQRVRQRTAELEATNQELEAFAYSVSHDLRAPLRAMDGFARILAEDAMSDLTPQAQRYLHRIRHNAQQMDLLIQELLRFSRLNRQPLESEVVDPGDVVAEVLAGMEEDRAGRDVEVRVTQMPAVRADRTLLKVVYDNLLANAFKYTRDRDRACVEVGATANNGQTNTQTVFYVRDNGVGFDMKYADKVFGVFQRLHRAEEYEGTGVGLATVQRIIRRHGGRVWIEAAVDKGTTVYFTLEEQHEELPHDA